MNHLPDFLYTAAQTRVLDNIAINDCGVSGIQLMKRAARVVFDTISKHYPKQVLQIFCGAGNNGGDGYLIAGLAREARWPVQVYWLSNPENLDGDAKQAFDFAVQTGVSIEPFNETRQLTEGIVIDAMLGTGLTREVVGSYKQAINLINANVLPVVAVDIPSGLSADTGMVQGVAVKAERTVTFIALKQGLFTGEAPDYCGQIIFDDLNVPADIYYQVTPVVKKLDINQYVALLAPRKRCAHKGDFGRLLVIGGDAGFGGAVAMTTEAALRTGAGLVSVATRPEHVAPILARTPEAMVKAVNTVHELKPLLDQANVLVVGPGLGQSAWSHQVLELAIQADLPMVLDADALNLLAENGTAQLKGNTILTPHPGEAARLLGQTVAVIQGDRFAAVRNLQEKYQAAVLLKGAGSLICTDQQNIGLSSYGNPGMATGGMGDVLSGIIAGLLSQGIATAQALPLAVCLHGMAADIVAAQKGERGMLPTDLFSVLQKLVNGIW